MIDIMEDYTGAKSNEEDEDNQGDDEELDDMDRLMFTTMERNKQEFKRCTQKKSKIFDQKE